MFFIDYGNVEDIILEEIVIIDKKNLNNLGDSVVALIQVPALAMECSLAFTKPNSLRSNKESWDDEAIEIFAKMLKNQNSVVLAEIYSVTPGYWAPFITVFLYANQQDRLKVCNIK